jgi:tetratricopeptide (TPR) repeat protein
MALGCLLSALLLAAPQSDAYQVLNRAYEQLRLKQYDEAVAGFRRGLELDPSHVSVFKDLGYTLQKMGETEQAVEAFEAYHAAVPGDYQTIMELAYLYAQVQKEDRALDFFRLAMRSPDPAQAALAHEGFDNVERPILGEIERWSGAIQTGNRRQDAANFDARESLAAAYVRHGDAALAIEQYVWLRKNAPSRYRHLITLAELHGKLGHADIARAYALLALRAPDARVSVQGRALFGERYPYGPEFEKALELEPWQTELRKEVAYLYLQMGMRDRAIAHFERLSDAQSVAQLAMLRPALATPPPPPPPIAGDSVQHHKELGYASIAKSFLDDAVREFKEVHRLDPGDDQAVLQLGYLYNMLKQDPTAIGWFKRARASRDQKVAEQAKQALHNLEKPLFTTTIWALPLISSRFSTAFGYGQIKSELNIAGLKRVRPYLSMRFEGDSRSRTGGTNPEVLSADGGVAAAGAIATLTNHVWLWGEAGNALSAVTAPSHPDYRGGLGYAQVWGAGLFGDSTGRFLDTTFDAVYFSRLSNDVIAYSQTKTGYQLPALGGLHHQVFLASNVVTDRDRSVFNNFVEFGPGYRFGWKRFPHTYAYVAWLHGVYTLPGKSNYNDLRLVIWWAKSF